MHYEGELIDRTNTLYESTFGFSKYRNWQTFNESLPFSSVYGIVPVNSKYTSLLKKMDDSSMILSKQATLNYLGARQKSSIPFLPIRGIHERQLAHIKLNELVAQQKSMASQTIFGRNAMMRSRQERIESTLIWNMHPNQDPF